MPDDRPNVLFLLSDEHAFRYFSHLDDDRGEPVSTPRFDDLAESAAVFDQTYCQMPLCTPSRLCMLTGREVQRCGAWTNEAVLRPDLPTLPGAFSGAGYETALVGKMHLGGDRQSGGFDHRPYGDLTGRTGHQWDPPEPGQERGHDIGRRIPDAGVTGIPESLLQEYNVTRESLSFLREHRHANPDQPWFLCASFSRPHFPLTAPQRYIDRYWPDGVTEPKVGRTGDTVDHPMTEGMAEGFRVDEFTEEQVMRARAAYFACVDFLDDILDEFLATLAGEGLLEDTVVVYTSDHGELAGEHGMWWKHSWHEAATRVPWFVQTPAHRSGDRAASRLQTPASLADLFPTLCGLADVEAPAGLDGEDLSAAVRTGEEPDRGPVFCDNLNPRWGEGTEFRMVRDGGYKYVGFRDAPELLFDLDADPGEQTNLATDATGEDAAALERLRTLVADTVDFDEAEAQRRRDAARKREEHALGIPRGTGNAYAMPDGRIVDADSPLYRPHVLADDPTAAFADWPESFDRGGDPLP